MKKTVLLIAFVILITSFIVLLKKESDRRKLPEEYMIYLEEWQAKVDNITPASDKITKTYECDFLLGGIDYLMKETPPECVRYNNGMYYFVYKTEKGYYFISPNYRRRGDSWMFVDKLYVDDFNIIKKNETTMGDVKEIDEYARYISWSGVVKPPYSVHFTVDGYKIVIKYAKKALPTELVNDIEKQRLITVEEGFVVDKIKKYKGRRNPYSNLLPIDKELLE